MTMYGLVFHGMVLYVGGYTLTSGAQYRITDGPQARTARCMDHWTPHLGFDIQKLNSIEMGRRKRRKELNRIMRQWLCDDNLSNLIGHWCWWKQQPWQFCSWKCLQTSLVPWWWCEGSCFNRESDLSLNPDLLQNWTMGDYEADYCGRIYWDDVTH